MIKNLNRNKLKLIALAIMLIDHIGFYFLNNNIYFRIIGRISFPIFAFFVAEGYHYTRNKKRYFNTLALFAVISQVPYYLMIQRVELNILFTFIFAIILIRITDKRNLAKSVSSHYSDNTFVLIMYHFALIIMYLAGLISYGYFGVILVAMFYYYRHDRTQQMKYFAIINTLITLPYILSYPYNIQAYIQLFAIAAIPILMLYNGNKGKASTKYLFYIVYPCHMLLFYCIGLLI